MFYVPRGDQQRPATIMVDHEIGMRYHAAEPIPVSREDIVSSRTVEQKARVLAHAAGLAGDELIRYPEGEGIRLSDFRRWRLALEEAGEESVGMAKRIGSLERELARKERAFAEAAARLVFREPIESLIRNQNDNFDEQIDEEGDLRSAT
jgi:hypothetical protein